MESESVLRWGYRAYTSDKPRPIHLTTQNTAGASISLGTIPMVLPVMAQWALNDWPAYFSKIMSNSLPVVLPLQPMALHAVPQTQSDAHFWSCSLGLQYPFFRPSSFPLISCLAVLWCHQLFLDYSILLPLSIFFTLPTIIHNYLFICLLLCNLFHQNTI